MYTIATLDDLRRHLNLSATDAADDEDLLQRLGAASRLIESLTQRRYCPAFADARNRAGPRQTRAS